MCIRNIVFGSVLKPWAAVIMTLLPAFVAYAAVPDADTASVCIDAASVYGSRPLIAAGMHRTPFDSLALKENISLSFADILSYNSSVFVKQYGRATQSTVSFRGTSASHTQVLWNGMKLNSPMLGMTDFSMIPAFLTDSAELLHGSSSLQAVSGGLGGAVLLHTEPRKEDGFSMQFVQGFGSFLTVDDFLRLDYGHKRFHASLRAVFSYSPNRFRYTNMDKKENVYDDEMNIISSYHPVEYNENGKFRDYHILFESGYETEAGDRFSLSVWHLGSYRQLPKLTVDYSDPGDFINEQNEVTTRAVASWRRSFGNLDLSAHAGYANTDFISTKDKHDNKPIPDTRVPGTGLLQTSYSNFHAHMIGSNRAAKKPFFLQLLTSPDPSLHELFELRFGSSRQKP